MQISRQFLTFIAVGVASAIVDIATIQLVMHQGGHYALAVSVGFAVGLIANFALHLKVTFRSASSMAVMSKFGAVVCLNYLITMIFAFASVRMLGSVLAGKIASLPVIAVNGFLLSRFWVFR